MAKENWSDAQNELIVADYFAMLAKDDRAAPYNKAAHNRALQALTGRRAASIEFKHQNISAVLKGLGENWIPGYKPAFNFQLTLVDAVLRWIDQNPDWVRRPVTTSAPVGLMSPSQIWIEPAPTLRNAPPPAETDLLSRIGFKGDVAERDARNRDLGKAGEALVVLHEQAVLRSAGRDDLARDVRWVSQEDGDGLGYDIASFSPSGQVRLIEVKTTRGWERTPFHISRNELEVAEARHEEWCLFRLWNVARTPRAFELRPPLARHVSLTPTSFLASFAIR